MKLMKGRNSLKITQINNYSRYLWNSLQSELAKTVNLINFSFSEYVLFDFNLYYNKQMSISVFVRPAFSQQLSHQS